MFCPAPLVPGVPNQNTSQIQNKSNRRHLIPIYVRFYAQASFLCDFGQEDPGLLSTVLPRITLGWELYDIVDGLALRCGVRYIVILYATLQPCTHTTGGLVDWWTGWRSGAGPRSILNHNTVPPFF